ncbi:TIM barrel protein [archaeon]|nr:TIM barrel protein [archaeon]
MITHGIIRSIGADIKSLVKKAKNKADYLELYPAPLVTREDVELIINNELGFQFHENPVFPLFRAVDRELFYQDKLRVLKDCVKLLADYNGNQLLIHTPQLMYFPSGDLIRLFELGINKLYPYCESKGVTLSIELLDGFSFPLLHYLMKKNDWPNIRVTYDFRRSPLMSYKAGVEEISEDFTTFLDLISSFHTIYIGRTEERRGGAIGKIEPAEKINNFKRLLESLKFFNWSGGITCEHPDSSWAIKMVKRTNKYLEDL